MWVLHEGYVKLSLCSLYGYTPICHVLWQCDAQITAGKPAISANIIHFLHVIWTGYPQDFINQIPCIFSVLFKKFPCVFCVKYCTLNELFFNKVDTIHSYGRTIVIITICFNIPCIFPVFITQKKFRVFSWRENFQVFLFSVCFPCAVGILL
jgi:hypothetical protein